MKVMESSWWKHSIMWMMHACSASVSWEIRLFNSITGLDQILFSRNENCGTHTCQHFMQQGLHCFALVNVCGMSNSGCLAGCEEFTGLTLFFTMCFQYALLCGIYEWTLFDPLAPLSSTSLLWPCQVCVVDDEKKCFGLFEASLFVCVFMVDCGQTGLFNYTISSSAKAYMITIITAGPP